MRYALLVYGSGDAPGSVALAPVATATSIRVRDGDTVVTDGPFAETEETLGGWYLVEAATLDEAIEAAARIPAATDGTIEIRPVRDEPEDGG